MERKYIEVDNDRKQNEERLQKEEKIIERVKEKRKGKIEIQIKNDNNDSQRTTNKDNQRNKRDKKGKWKETKKTFKL